MLKKSIAFTALCLSISVIAGPPVITMLPYDYRPELALNSANPYDIGVGVAHNKVMELGCVRDFGQMDTLEKYISMRSQQQEEVGLSGPEYDVETSLKDFASNKELYKSLINASTAGSALIKNGQFSPKGASHYVKLIRVMDTISNQNFQYAVFKKSVDAVEKSIALDNTLTKNEQAALLKAGSIARHSTLFWLNNPKSIIKDNIPKDDFPTTQGEKDPKDEKDPVKEVAKADVAGAIVGAIVTAPSGPGAAGGALTGALTGSMTQCVIGILDIIWK
jgi:hypothetical protein